MSAGNDSQEAIKHFAKQYAEEQEKLANCLNIHGKGEANVHVIEQTSRHAASVPTIVGAAVRSYAQYGEDIIVKSLLMVMAPERYRHKKVFYFDIGANHPINTSNTWLFHEEGMAGILVEPNPALHENLERIRTNDILIKGSVGFNDDPDADFYLPPHHELGSNSRDFIRAYHRQRNLDDNGVITLKVRTYDFNQLVKEHCPGGILDFLSIDVEGFDFDVLLRIDLKKCRPLIICIEPSSSISGCGLENNDRLIKDYLCAKGYELVSMTSANLIFADATYSAAEKI